MEKESITKKVSLGICSFCKEELPKSKMTTHLKYCKQRALAQSTETSTTAKARRSHKEKFLHLVVEGRYNPEYWIHLEVPASAMLAEVDYFLRDIWLECCGHLSAFKIGNVLYSSNIEDDELELVAELNEPLTEATTPGKPEALSPGEVQPEELPENISLFPPKLLSLLTGGKSEEEAADLLRILSQDLLSIEAGWGTQERSMDIELGDVLQPGKKFTYEYDFGSTTDLKLRVVGEREAQVRGKKKEVQVLARNSAPEILCNVCGKPATKVAMGYYDVEENAFCDKCAKKITQYDEGMLPIVNSPRVGVCAYSG